MFAGLSSIFARFVAFRQVSRFPRMKECQKNVMRYGIGRRCHAGASASKVAAGSDAAATVDARRTRASPVEGAAAASRRSKGSTALPRAPTASGDGATPARLLRRSPPETKCPAGGHSGGAGFAFRFGSTSSTTACGGRAGAGNALRIPAGNSRTPLRTPRTSGRSLPQGGYCCVPVCA